MLDSDKLFSLRSQDKDPEDIAEDFRDAIWGVGEDVESLATVWAAARCFVDALYWKDEYSCVRPDMPEGVERLSTSLGNVAHYVLYASNSNFITTHEVLTRRSP